VYLLLVPLIESWDKNRRDVYRFEFLPTNFIELYEKKNPRGLDVFKSKSVWQYCENYTSSVPTELRNKNTVISGCTDAPERYCKQIHQKFNTYVPGYFSFVKLKVKSYYTRKRKITFSLVKTIGVHVCQTSRPSSPAYTCLVTCYRLSVSVHRQVYSIRPRKEKRRK